MERRVSSILIVAASDDEVVAAEYVSDEALGELAAALGSKWQSVIVQREPPPIWAWEPLIDAGVISLASIVAFAEVRIENSEGDKRALRDLVRSWLRTVRFGLRVRIVWADCLITSVTETLDPGVSEEMEPYGCEIQVA
jgi:hypothetical protein